MKQLLRSHISCWWTLELSTLYCNNIKSPIKSTVSNIQRKPDGVCLSKSMHNYPHNYISKPIYPPRNILADRYAETCVWVSFSCEGHNLVITMTTKASGQLSHCVMIGVRGRVSATTDMSIYNLPLLLFKQSSVRIKASHVWPAQHSALLSLSDGVNECAER